MSSLSSGHLRRLIALLGALVLVPLAVVLAAAPAQADTAYVSGEVVDGFGEGLAGVTIEGLTAPNYLSGDSTTSDADGHFELPVGDGTYRLRYSKGGYDTAFYGGGTGVDLVVSDGVVSSDGEPFEDNQLDQVMLTATATYAVTGVVQNAGSTPLSGITVEAFVSGDDETAVDTATTNGSGAYSLDLPSGLYQVRFNDPSHAYLTTWYDGTGPDPTEITVNAAKTLATVTLTTPPPASEFPIAGAVVDALGDAVDGVTVTVTGVGGSTDGGTDSTKQVGADHGVYSVAVLPGTYQLAFSKTGFVTKSYGDASAATVTVAANGDLSVPGETLVANRLGDLTLQSAPFTLSGTVATAGGAGIDGITVRAFPEGSTDPAEVVDTDLSSGGGHYALDLPIGSYDLQYTDTDGTAPTYTSSSLSLVRIVQGGALSIGGTPAAGLPDVQLALSSADTPHPVIGSVVDVNGADVDGLTATATPQGTGEVASDATGADGAYGDHGRYRLMLKPGDYVVDIDGASHWADTTYTGDGTTSALVTVQLNGTVLVNGVEAVGGDLGSTKVTGTTKYSLSGTVKEGSTGLSGITVTAYDEDAPTLVVAQTTSGANGTWSLTGAQGLVVGSYLVEFSGSAGGNAYDRAYFGGTTPKPVTMVQGGVATVDGSGLVPSNTLPAVAITRSSADTLHPVTGAVTDANDDPLAGVTVTPSGGPTTTAATSDSGGAYTLNLKAGTYTLTYTRSGFTQATYPSTVTVALDGTVTPGELDPVSLQQSTGTGTISGKVVNANGGAGLGGITVTVVNQGDFGGTAVATTSTATSGTVGSWSVNNLKIGTYAIVFSGSSGGATYDATYYGGTTTATAKPVKVGQTNVTVDDVPQVGGALGNTAMTQSSADTPHPVTGGVDDANGDPVQGVTVTATGGPAASPATSGVEGDFTLQLKPGTYTLTFTKSGFSTTTYPGSGAATVPVTVALDGSVTPATLDRVTLEDATGTAALSGRATNGATGLSGIQVDLFPAGDFSADSRIAALTSGANGAWSFSGLKIGTYDVRFSGSAGGQTYVTTYYGGATSSTTTPIKVGQGDVVSVGGSTKAGGALGDTVLTATTASTTYALIGSVSDANDDPLVGVTVQALAINGGATATSTTTDAGGAYSLPLTKGTYEVRFDKTGFTGAYYPNADGGHARVVVADGGGMTIDGDEVAGSDLGSFTLIGTSMYAVTGTATGPGATPVGGITVTATPDVDGNPTRTAVTAADGTFTITAPVGSYRVRFNDTRAGSPSPRYQVTFYGSAETRVRVTATGLVHVDPDGAEHAIAGLGTVTLPVADSSTTYALTGTTYDPNFDTLAGVIVTAVPVAGTPDGNFATSDSDGGFTIQVKAGKYQLQYAKPGYHTAFLIGDDGTAPATIIVSATGEITAPAIEGFELPVDLQLLFPAAAFRTAPKLSGKVAVGQVVSTTFGVLQGAAIDKDYVTMEWFLDGKPADDYSFGGYFEKFKVPAVAATKKLSYRITIDDPDGLRASTVFTSKPVAVPKAPATVKGVFKKGKLTVTLTVPGLPKPTGVIVVKDGKKKVATIKLTAKSKGKAVVKLSKLKPGKHTLTLAYAGSKTIAPAKAKVKVTIKK